MSIKITIEKTVVKTWKARENALTKRTPTEITETISSNYTQAKKEVKFIDEYAIVEVDKRQESTVKILEQIIEDEDLDLASIIVAINKLSN